MTNPVRGRAGPDYARLIVPDPSAGRWRDA